MIKPGKTVSKATSRNAAYNDSSRSDFGRKSTCLYLILAMIFITNTCCLGFKKEQAATGFLANQQPRPISELKPKCNYGPASQYSYMAGFKLAEKNMFELADLVRLDDFPPSRHIVVPLALSRIEAFNL